MANVTMITNTLAAGELAPRTEGLVNQAIYNAGARTLENIIPMRVGGFRRMPGSYYLGGTYSGAKARLIQWRAPSTRYICEFTNNKIRFWLPDHTLYGAPLEVVSDYTLTQLWEIQYKSIKGKLWLVHPSHPPRYLEESGGVPTLTTPTFTGDRTFDSANNYPSIVEFVAGRLGLGATNAEPNAHFLSRAPDASTGSDRFTDFTLGEYADDAIILKESEERFLWIVSHRGVLSGGINYTWISDGSIPTPLSYDLNVLDYGGSAAIQAVAVGPYVFFVTSGTPSLHMVYLGPQEEPLDPEANIYSDHILRPGIVEMVAMFRPQPYLWLVRSDGQLVSCTVKGTGEGAMIFGWARQKPADGGLVESAAVLPVDGGDDELWVSVLRGSNRVVEYYVLAEEGEDFSESHYVDSGFRKTYGTPTQTITGLDHLEGKEVDAIGDGQWMPRKTVSGGQVTYETGVNLIHIGLPHPAKILTQRPELALNLTWQGKRKRIEEIVLRLYRSYGGAVGQSESDLHNLQYDQYGPYSGDLVVPLAGTVDTDGAFWLVQNDPFPLNCLAMFTRIALMEA